MKQQPKWIKEFKKSDFFKTIEQPPYDDIRCWHKDPASFFIIKIEDNNIHCGVVDYNMNIHEEIIAKTPQQIFYYLCNQTKWITRLDHAAYLGKELARAQWCLERGEIYEQE